MESLDINSAALINSLILYKLHSSAKSRLVGVQAVNQVCDLLLRLHHQPYILLVLQGGRHVDREAEE